MSTWLKLQSSPHSSSMIETVKTLGLDIPYSPIITTSLAGAAATTLTPSQAFVNNSVDDLDRGGRSPGGPSAVDQQPAAGHQRRGLRGEKNRRAHQILDGAE